MRSPPPRTAWTIAISPTVGRVAINHHGGAPRCVMEARARALSWCCQRWQAQEATALPQYFLPPPSFPAFEQWARRLGATPHERVCSPHDRRGVEQSPVDGSGGWWRPCRQLRRPPQRSSAGVDGGGRHVRPQATGTSSALQRPLRARRAMRIPSRRERGPRPLVFLVAVRADEGRLGQEQKKTRVPQAGVFSQIRKMVRGD